MDYKKLFTDIKGGELKNVYLFHGKEEFTKEEALRLLQKNAVTNPELNITTLENVSVNDVAMACDMIPFMDTKRIVILKQLFKDKEAKAFIEYIKTIPKETILVIYITGNADSKGIIYKALNQEDCVIEFPALTDTEAIKFSIQHCRKNGCIISSQCADYLVTLVGKELTNLDNEINKLCDYVGEGGEITSETVKKIVIKNQEYQLFIMYACFVNKNFSEGFNALESIISGKTGSGAEEECIGIAGYFTRCLKNVYIAKSVMLSGGTKYDIESKLNLKGRTVSDIIKVAERYSMEHILKAMNSFSNVFYVKMTGQKTAQAALSDAIFFTFAGNS